MINLSPINKKIRTTLENRSRAVKRGTDVNFGPQTDGSGKINASDTFTKSLWIKVFSPVDATAVATETPDDLLDEQGEPVLDVNDNNIKRIKKVSGIRKDKLNTVTILGGEALKDGTMFHGFDEMYSGTKEGFKRPLAGIKDISVGYKGMLAAIREATINWVCWSFEDLEKLSPHFFSHGKGLLIEWGWSGTAVDTSIFNEDDMLNGTVYQSIQNRVIENGGNYDAMAGVISNWEWTLRADGGFDCMTKVTSRGVNMLDSSAENPGLPSFTGKVEDEQQPSLPDFCAAIKETVYSLAVTGKKWYGDGPEDNLPPYVNKTELTGNVWSGDWKQKVKEEEGGTQPPGVLVNIAYGDKFWGWFSKKKAGPYFTWGFFEDNVLSRFLGKYSNETKLMINSFRSLQPVLFDDESGDFLKAPTEEEAGLKFSSQYSGEHQSFLYGGGSPPTKTSKIHEAQFESTIIRNHKHLYTPFRDRWILPNQFPGEYVIPENANSVIGAIANFFSNEWDEKMTMDTAKKANNQEYYRPFAINQHKWEYGGYLRNILVSYEIIEDAFKNAKTMKEGVQTVMDEINRDVDGFWRFEIVVDPYIDGNCKVIDMNYTAYTVKELLDDKKAAIPNEPNSLNGNPTSKLFTFPSWGEASIVKTQSLKTKVPSAMAVTAMYAGSAKNKEQGSMGDEAGTAVGLLTGDAGLIDQSQKDIRMAWRAGKEDESFVGSISPYGNIPSEGPRANSYGMGQRMAGDGRLDTNVPSSNRARIADFGYGHGVPMDKIGYMKMIADSEEYMEEREKDTVEAKSKELAKGLDAIHNFLMVTSAPNDGAPISLEVDKKARIKGHAAMDCAKHAFVHVDWHRHGFVGLYDENGDMRDYPKGKTPILFRRTMMDFIHGNIPEVDHDDMDKIDVLIPIEMEITIDGIGGILPGNVWTVDYIPKRYRDFCVFQTLSINQTVSDGEWTTTLKGQIRPAMKYLIDSEILGINEEQAAAQAELG
jgi:hypothetical protein